MKNVKFLLNGVFFIFLISIFAQKVEAQYFIDFEGPGETKTGYASGTVNLSGLDWNMTEALIGTLDADWKKWRTLGSTSGIWHLSDDDATE
jgi:hypothetical protein